MALQVIEIQQTCGACPSQWEGRLLDGRYFYARYRWGHLAVTAGASVDDAVGAYWTENPDVIYEGVHGDGLDGCMGTAEMLSLAGMELT